MKIAPSLLACLLVALPATALADSHGGGNHNGSRQPQQAPHYQAQRAPQQQRYQAPQQRYQAPQQRYQAPQQRYQAPQQRFQAAQQPTLQRRFEQQRAPQRYQQQPAQRYDQRVARNVQPMPRYDARGSYGGGRIENPRGWTRAWQWNGGRQWVGDNDYWGGGFWGALTINLGGGGGGYGGYGYDNYYAVEQNSPGAQLLAQYGLTQTDCNQPNLVQIDGPDGSEICAYPNDEVAPGAYQIDPQTLSLVSY